ncbi:MAG TPA: cysteine--tRNA ligase [Acidimicrobiales bacterium]|nr:cysteine--tRNA ligase [Acidimicrobiales bacterium]
MIRLFDSAQGEVRELVLRDPGQLSMYLCGPTVYEVPHLGHGRHMLVWDVARRWFTFRGLSVHFVSNITDIDDKIIARAAFEHLSETAVAQRGEEQWFAAQERLGVERPSDVPHATHYVEAMVELIEELLKRGVGYVLEDGVYFDVSKVPDYGLLAGQPLESLRAGARVEANDQKRSALDFALWKFAKFGEPSWMAPFGPGRPGWHTECVVMSLHLLGEDFDLHCGGLDLQFPHHENERAQAEVLGRAFARHWAHHGWVMSGSEKMSKSLDNYVSLEDLLTETDPRAYRLLVLRSHYRAPLEVTPDIVADAERTLTRLDGLARRFQLDSALDAGMVVATNREWRGDAARLYEAVGAFMDEDLNSPAALARLFEAVSSANALADRGDYDQARELAEAINVLAGAFGLVLRAGHVEIDPASAKLVRARDKARSKKEWARADQLRLELEGRGWTVEDSAAGTLIRKA